MTWTVVEDGGVVQVRASISECEQLDALIKSLESKREFLKRDEQPKEKTDE